MEKLDGFLIGAMLYITANIIVLTLYLTGVWS